MSAVANILNTENNEAHLTNISVNARIDYILRFNNQAIIVAGETSQQYSPVCSQFLSSLSSYHNAAYISVSNQLQDIQIRSRIIEQLFADVLFDPEQSLALSLINLARSQPQKIAIAIEHGQNLSIQILHELTQLAEVAKKSQLAIDIVIAGDHSLGYKLRENSILFKGKISVLSAETGQIIGLNSPLFKAKTNWLTLNYSTLIFVILSLVIIALGFFIQMTMSSSSEEPAIQIKTNEQNKMVSRQTKATNESFVTIAPKITYATSADILGAIESEPEIQESASAQEILSALIDADADKQVITQQELKISEKSNQLTSAQSSIDNKFGPFQNGFVIQFAAFSDESVKNKFIQQYPQLDYLSYQRLINGKPFEVLTSKTFNSKEQARKAIEDMPKDLKDLNIWIKSVEIIKTEILLYQSSQL